MGGREVCVRAWTVQSTSVEQTRDLGRRLGQTAPPGAVVALVGDLGAGKTALTQGLGEGLGLTSRVQSPTFVLAQDHPDGRLPLVHADLYRVERPDEAAQLGLEDRMDEGGVVVVEWADRFPELLPADHLAIHLAHRGDAREITLRATGARHAAWLAAAEAR